MFQTIMVIWSFSHGFYFAFSFKFLEMSKPVLTACIRLRIAAQQAKPSAAIGQVGRLALSVMSRLWVRLVLT